MTSGGVESSIAASTLYTRSASYAHCSDLCLEPNDIFAPEWRRSLILHLHRRGACLSLHAFGLHVHRSIGVKFQKVRNLHICDLRLYGTVAAFVLITCGTQTDGGRRTSRASMGVVSTLNSSCRLFVVCLDSSSNLSPNPSYTGTQTLPTEQKKRAGMLKVPCYVSCQ